jgi:chromosome segregation ATPase
LDITAKDSPLQDVINRRAPFGDQMPDLLDQDRVMQYFQQMFDMAPFHLTGASQQRQEVIEAFGTIIEHIQSIRVQLGYCDRDLTLAGAEMSAAQRRLLRAKGELSTTKRELTEKQEELRAIQEMLLAMKQELLPMSEEMKRAQSELQPTSEKQTNGNKQSIMFFKDQCLTEMNMWNAIGGHSIKRANASNESIFQ